MQNNYAFVSDMKRRLRCERHCRRYRSICIRLIHVKILIGVFFIVDRKMKTSVRMSVRVMNRCDTLYHTPILDQLQNLLFDSYGRCHHLIWLGRRQHDNCLICLLRRRSMPTAFQIRAMDGCKRDTVKIPHWQRSWGRHTCWACRAMRLGARTHTWPTSPMLLWYVGEALCLRWTWIRWFSMCYVYF